MGLEQKQRKDSIIEGRKKIKTKASEATTLRIRVCCSSLMPPCHSKYRVFHPDMSISISAE
jgi:hypothetical protein